ncbi:Igd1p SCDLUD_003511 [Saccharomycodes ludwigii]|uniref:Igd1p n=1 Tax=Saccharomycodes ludwigii TaxID=36035 RepID=UPI001E85A771|nr:hypothetical protein SCDLUD_003511 [Saccharomycodes ludwigii]KAH3900524.1 hypothetical protein SCDLUD_003511 [Saccharomycodes ludwigii]
MSKSQTPFVAAPTVVKSPANINDSGSNPNIDSNNLLKAPSPSPFEKKKYEESSDFINLSEPPKALESPSASSYNLSGRGANNNDTASPTTHLFKSTKFNDYLNDVKEWVHHQHRVSSPTDNDYNSGEASYNNNSHNENSSNDKNHLNSEGADESNRNHVPSDKIEFKQQYQDDKNVEQKEGTTKENGSNTNHHNNDGNNGTPASSQLPRRLSLDRRRSSCSQFEDYKKEVYSKLHLFEK